MRWSKLCFFFTMNRSCSLCERPFQSVESWALHPDLLMHLSSAACPSYRVKVRPHFLHLLSVPSGLARRSSRFLWTWDLEGILDDGGWRGCLALSAQSGCSWLSTSLLPLPAWRELCFHNNVCPRRFVQMQPACHIQSRRNMKTAWHKVLSLLRTLWGVCMCVRTWSCSSQTRTLKGTRSWCMLQCQKVGHTHLILYISCFPSSAILLVGSIAYSLGSFACPALCWCMVTCVRSFYSFFF